jgi:outer membrane protein
MMKQFARQLVATFLAGILLSGTTSSAFGQNPPQQDQQNPQTPAQTTVGAGATPSVSLGTSKFSYTRAPRAFPNLIAPYKPISIPDPGLVNSPRIDQLIHENKLELTLQDAVDLALENNMDIVVARYNIWYADTDILRTLGGGVGRGTSGASIPFSQANIPGLLFDPQVTGTYSIDSRVIPVNNPFTSGTGTAGITALSAHTSTFNTQWAQGFSPGTSMFVSWNNTRSSSTSPAILFNPSVESSINIGFQQQLLNGFGRSINKRQIYIAKNNRKIADLAFTQQAITTITNTINTYWELVFARDNVNVQQQAVTVSEKLYNDNKKQLEIGTMAPLDVTRAESELATNRQNLIVAQTAQLQQQQALKNLISKNPLSPNLARVELIPTDKPNTPTGVEPGSFEEAVNEAFQKRPDLQEQIYNLKNADIEVKATRNALLPVATLTAQYGTTGLSGNTGIAGAPVTSAGAPIVNSAGVPVTVTDPNTGLPIQIFEPFVSSPTIGTSNKGFTDEMGQVFENKFPAYTVSLGVTIPIRNRIAQADHQRATLNQRQMQAQIQQLKNTATLDVQNTYVALVQDRARVDAASKARELQQQTFDAEEKKYQLGASTVYQVILTQRDLITARGSELRALSDLAEAKANFERALGRTLEANRVTIANSNTGETEKDTLIPGTLHGQVVGTEKLFKKLDSDSAAGASSSITGQK